MKLSARNVLKGRIKSVRRGPISSLVVLGVASFFVTDGTTRTALQVAYLGFAATALASEVQSIIGKVMPAAAPKA